jgi:hypothetical protein
MDECVDTSCDESSNGDKRIAICYGVDEDAKWDDLISRSRHAWRFFGILRSGDVERLKMSRAVYELRTNMR